MKLFVAVIACLVGAAMCNFFCKEDDDCGHLGNMFCIKSMCSWGTCACKRGFAARYVGSERNFQCVPIKKIGESCSDPFETGVCGAENSHCGDDGVCHCDATKVSRFGGEICLGRDESYASETQTQGIGNVCAAPSAAVSGNLWLNAVFPAPVPDVLFSGLPNMDMDQTPNQCGCGVASHTVLPNRYHISSFMGRKQPVCVSNGVGDFCLADSWCNNIQEPNGAGGWVGGRGECGTDNKCACKTTGYKHDITGLYCAMPLNAGASCMWHRGTVYSSSHGVCDGSAGLRCGDPCVTENWEGVLGSGNMTCVCDPSWEDGGSCTKKSLSSACNGDYNCQSYDMNSICVDGKCQDGAGAIVYSAITLLLPLLALLKQQL